MTEVAIDTHHLQVDFGRYRGELYTRLPVGYLRWMVNDGHGKADIARAELERRGLPLCDSPLEVSGHAIDKASQRALKIWRDDRNENEGLHRWLTRVGMEALNKQTPDAQGRVKHKGMKLVFVKGEIHWTLKTVIPEKS